MYIGIASPVSGSKLKEARKDARSGNPSRAFFCPVRTESIRVRYFRTGSPKTGFVVGSTRRIFITVPRFDVNTSIALGPHAGIPVLSLGPIFSSGLELEADRKSVV